MKKNFLSGLILLGCIGCLSLTGCGEKKIDLEKYISVSFSGMDYKGSASVNLDYDKLAQALTSKVGTQNLQNVYYLTSAINVALNQTEYLKNGDTVKVACIYDNDIAKDLGIRLTFDGMEVPVSGLSQAKLISAEELLDAANIILEGTSPYGKASFDNADNQYSSFVYYDLDKYNDIANGDVLELSLNIDDYQAEAEGCAVIGDEITRKLEVSGLPELISSFDEIADASMAAIKQQASDVMEAWKANHRSYNYNFTATQPVRIFFLSSKTDDNWGVTNMLVLVYKATEVHNSNGNMTDRYVAIAVENIVKNADGSNSCNLNEIYVKDYENDYNELYLDVIQSEMADYNVSEYEFN